MAEFIESPDGKSAIVADPDRPRLAGRVSFVPHVADPAVPTLAELLGGTHVGWADPDQFNGDNEQEA